MTDSKPLLSLEEFSEYIEAIIKYDNIRGAVYEASGGMIDLYYPDGDKDCTLYLEKLLSKVMHDKFEWISYWLWELNFGKEAHENTVTDDKGNSVPIKTIEDLYSILMEEYYDDNSEDNP